MLLTQEEMELNYAEQNAINLIILTPEFSTYLKDRLKGIMMQDIDKEWKQECFYHICDSNPDYLFKKMMVPFIAKDKVILQEIVGMIFNNFAKCSTKHRQGICVDCYLQAFFDGVNFSITQTKENYICTTAVDLSAAREKYKSMGYVLPSVEPLDEVSSNSIGYKTFKERIICGSIYNPTEYEKCLSHINRENRTKLSWDFRVLRLSPMKFDSTPEWKGDHWETAEEVECRRQSFELLKNSIPERVNKLEGRNFYIAHKYDKRGRCYCKAHEFNYMGAKGIKASISIAEKVLIKDTRK